MNQTTVQRHTPLYPENAIPILSVTMAFLCQFHLENPTSTKVFYICLVRRIMEIVDSLDETDNSASAIAAIMIYVLPDEIS